MAINTQNDGMLDALDIMPREPDMEISHRDDVKHLAILRRGNMWYHKSIPFPKDVRVVISQEIYLWMEEHAVDFVSSDDGEVTGKAKFQYIEDYTGPEPVGTALDEFEDLDDDKLRRKEAYREPYRAPVVRSPRSRLETRAERAARVEETLPAMRTEVPVRPRTRTR